MAKTDKTKQDNSEHALIDKLVYVLDRFKLNGTREAIAEVSRALDTFEANRRLWAYANNSVARSSIKQVLEARRVLQSHLLFTLFVPGGRADNARLAVDRLHQQGFFPFIDDLPWTVSSITPCIQHLVRFPNQKAARVVQYHSLWHYSVCDTLHRAIVQGMSVTDINKYVRSLPGYGPKAAAHFMRNTGLGACPIIDTHILKAIAEMKFKAETYATAERSFAKMAEIFDVPLLKLDAILWCGYSKNWNVQHADFDNFGHKHEQ